MLVRFLGRRPELAVDDALRTLPALDWTNVDRRPGVVAYLPCYFGNPYQSLLYSDLPSHGFHAAPLYTAEQSAEFVDQVSGAGLEVIVHTHWLNSVTNRAKDEAEAQQAAKNHLEHLRRAQDMGAKLLWTVHNVLPHDTRFEDVDTELRGSMAELVDRIHVMSPRTRELVAPWFEVPEEKTFIVPHPGYQGVYPSWMPREQARMRLGIARDAIVFLMIGAIKPYKGLTELMDAFDELSRREPGRFVLLVAGNPDTEDETQRFVERAMTHPAVFAWFGKIPDDQMQMYLRAADIGVYPYRRSLNSGALALGLTFGLPAVMPQHSGEATAEDASYVEIYDGEDSEGLLKALTAAPRLLSDDARAAASATIDRVSPANVAHDFGDELRNWIDGESRAALQPASAEVAAVETEVPA